MWTVHGSTSSEDGDRAAETAGPGGNRSGGAAVRERYSFAAVETWSAVPGGSEALKQWMV